MNVVEMQGVYRHSESGSSFFSVNIVQCCITVNDFMLYIRVLKKVRTGK